MADQHGGAPIKAPNNFRNALIAASVALVIGAYMLGSKSFKPAGTGGEDGPEARISPVARIELAAGPSGPKVEKDGPAVYQAVCAACHDSGAAGAPKKGDNAAWAPRLKAGLDGLLKSAIAGKGAMPPKGGNPDLNDAEVARAIAFVANQSGASFKAPAMP